MEKKSCILILPHFREGTDFVSGLNKAIEEKCGHLIEVEPFFVPRNYELRYQAAVLGLLHVADVVVIDCTMPKDLSEGTVYPFLPAQVNSLNHVIVVSETQLPLNVTPYRVIGLTDKEIMDGGGCGLKDVVRKRIFDLLPKMIEASLLEDTYARMTMEEFQDLQNHRGEMERMLEESLARRRKRNDAATRVMISYRSRHAEEVSKFIANIQGKTESDKEFRDHIGAHGSYEVKMLPPASLCGEREAHTPMRRWMLAGILEDHIREVDEVWVYKTDDYFNSWWTMAEMVMVANVRGTDGGAVKLRVYDPASQILQDAVGTPFDVVLTEERIKRLARYLSNTRPDTMGPECRRNMESMKAIAETQRNMPKFLRKEMLENLRQVLEDSIPVSLPPAEKEKMLADMMAMYEDPEKLEAYASDEVFSDEYWSQISYQVTDMTPAYKNGKIDVDAFMSCPMKELLPLSEDEMISRFATRGTFRVDGNVTLEISKASYDRYLWLASRMGQATVGDAEGLAVVPIFNVKRKD